MKAPLQPAEAAFTADGTPWSPLYDDVYHSAKGGLAQARHVFLAGNALPQRWRNTSASAAASPNGAPFVILETGFGLGLNFLATWQAWRDAGRPCPLHFISVEKHPFRRDDLAALLAPHAELAELAALLLAQWPLSTPDVHRLHFEHNALVLTLIFDDALPALNSLVAATDAVYLDGFAPAKNPDLWSPALLAVISRRCRTGATLATWSVAGELRRTLEQNGWRLQRQPGFANKREMLTGHLPQPPIPRGALGHVASLGRGDIAVSPTPTFSRHALVIGAGLAGTAVSERLAARGWQIDLFERHAEPAHGASGNPAGIILPRPAKDDGLGGRLSRASYLYALRQFASLPDLRWSPCGVLQIARDAAHEELQRSTAQTLGLPSDYMRFLERDEAEANIGHRLTFGGWWFPAGGWVSPPSLCAALLAACGAHLRRHFTCDIAAITHDGEQWHAFDHTGQLRAKAPCIVFANAHEANRLLTSPLPLTPVRGQISYLPPDVVPDTRAVLCRTGYLTPSAAGIRCIGASFDHDDLDLDLRTSDHAGNLDRLNELLPGAAAGIDPSSLHGRVGLRVATIDRLPLAGALPDPRAPLIERPKDPSLARLPRLPNAFCLLGLGSRGMVWAPLAAELIASQMHGDPLPLPRDLIDAVDPARFHLRALRRQA